MYKFEKKSDSLVSLGIGKKALIARWLDEMGVTNYIINDDYTIDVKGNVNLYNKGLDKFPDYIKFGKVGGSFSCSYNQLVSLEGCPDSVGGSFDCSDNKKQFSKEEVKKVCKVKYSIYV